MKTLKHLVIIALFNLPFLTIKAQVWISSGNDIYTNPIIDMVGIGTDSPSEKLHVKGNVLVKGLTEFIDNGEFATLYLGDNSNYIKAIHGEGLKIGTYCWNAPGYVDAISVNLCGQVGIGTSDPGANQLAVEGYIGARGVKVTSIYPFPDYVFEPNYKLMSIPELKEYIDHHHHLPNIPSAKEVDGNDVDLYELQLKLLEKIEEQALYIIDLQSQIDELSAQNTK